MVKTYLPKTRGPLFVTEPTLVGLRSGKKILLLSLSLSSSVALLPFAQRSPASHESYDVGQGGEGSVARSLARSLPPSSLPPSLPPLPPCLFLSLPPSFSPSLPPSLPHSAPPVQNYLPPTSRTTLGCDHRKAPASAHAVLPPPPRTPALASSTHHPPTNRTMLGWVQWLRHSASVRKMVANSRVRRITSI